MRDAQRLSNVFLIENSLSRFYQNNKSFPDDAGSTPVMLDGVPSFQTFLSSWPQAPTPPDGTCTAAQNEYVYEGRNEADTTADATDPGFYRVTFCLGQAIGDYSAGVHVLTSTGIR